METENLDKKTENLDNVGIGTKETEKLTAVPVEVMGHRIALVEKDGKEIGKKVFLICKHPAREEMIELSKVKYIKSEKVTTSGIWFNKDVDGLIPKQSALAEVMRKFQCNTIADFDGKEIATDLDNGYLVVKAY